MSIAKVMGIRSTAVSLLESAFFFLLLTPTLFVGTGFIYKWITAGLWEARPETFWDMFSLVPAMPLWLLLTVSVAYLLLIIFYWTPGELAQNETELWGFVLFLAVAAAAVGTWLVVTNWSQITAYFG